MTVCIATTTAGASINKFQISVMDRFVLFNTSGSTSGFPILNPIHNQNMVQKGDVL